MLHSIHAACSKKGAFFVKEKFRKFNVLKKYCSFSMAYANRAKSPLISTPYSQCGRWHFSCLNLLTFTCYAKADGRADPFQSMAWGLKCEST